jgi:hypothetical protein
MSDINWWLMVFSFVSGLTVTLALMVRRAKREVPVHGGAAAEDEPDKD